MIFSPVGEEATAAYESLRPAEASRALRKKLKHGNSHQQYRSMVVRDVLLSPFLIALQGLS